MDTSDNIATVLANRLKKVIPTIQTNNNTITSKYSNSISADNKAKKKLEREREQLIQEAKSKQSIYSPEDISKMSNTCVVLFNQYEKMLLERIVGSVRCDHMLSSEKMTFMFK